MFEDQVRLQMIAQLVYKWEIIYCEINSPATFITSWAEEGDATFISTVFALIYVTAKSNCIGDRSTLIRMCLKSFPFAFE